jgi:hypothetical protein
MKMKKSIQMKNMLIIINIPICHSFPYRFKITTFLEPFLDADADTDVAASGINNTAGDFNTVDSNASPESKPTQKKNLIKLQNNSLYALLLVLL